MEKVKQYQGVLWAALILLGFYVGLRLGGPNEMEPEHDHEASTAETVAVQEIWTCSMHPQVRNPEQGLCPLCGMDLIPAESDSLGPWQLKMSDQAQKLAEIETAPVKREFVAREIRMVGKVEYDEKKVGVISAWTGGRVDRLYVDFTGMMVHKEDHLVDVYSPNLLTAQQELLSASEAFRNGLRNGANVQSTRKRMMATREKLRLLGLTQDQISTIETRGTPSDQLTIYSHLEGVVIKKHVVLGQYIKSGDPIYTVADLSRVWIKLDAYEGDIPWLRYAQHVEFQAHAWPGEVFRGKVVFIDPVLNPETRTVKVRLNVDNPHGKLKPDMFVRAVLFAKVGTRGFAVDASLKGKWLCRMHPEVVKESSGACDICGMDLSPAEELGLVATELDKAPLTIPMTAPLITGERAVVYVKDPQKEGIFQGREIVLGARAGDVYVVKEGLEEGDEVVVNGNFKIDSELQIRAKSSMMYHSEGQETEEQPTVLVDAAFGAHLKDLYNAYYNLQEALSKDDEATARTAGSVMEKALAEVESQSLKAQTISIWTRESQSLEAQLKALSKAGNIEGVRAAFEPLSSQVYRLIQQFGGNATAYRFHCPMAFNNKGAYWLQNNDQLANPYYGSAMYRCGSQVETLAVGEGHQHHD